MKFSALLVLLLFQWSCSNQPILGTAFRATYLDEDKKYGPFVAERFQMLVPEWEMSMYGIYNRDGKVNTAPMDRVLSFAQTHHLKVKGHPLLWYYFLPPPPIWKQKTDPRQIVSDYLKTVVGHARENYPETVSYWEVANELFIKAGKIRHSHWLKKGDNPFALIEWAYRYVHQLDPHAKLFYNDFDFLIDEKKRMAIYNWIKDALSRGVPIHGIGLQMMYTNVQSIDWNKLKRVMDQFAELGLEIHISEMQFALKTLELPTQTELIHQGKVYAHAYDTCKKHQACTSFIVWGASDRHSWLDKSPHPHYRSALLFNEYLRAKPAARAIGL